MSCNQLPRTNAVYMVRDAKWQRAKHFERVTEMGCSEHKMQHSDTYSMQRLDIDDGCKVW